MIRRGDLFVTYGENGVKKFKELRRMNYPLVHYEVGKEEPADE
jgi:hypothetical protein